jgi:hypothetical protein
MYGVRVWAIPQRQSKGLQIRRPYLQNNCNSVLRCRSYSSQNVNHPVFEKRPPFFWRDINNQKNFMNWAAKQLNIKEPSDWYKLSQKVRN